MLAVFHSEYFSQKLDPESVLKSYFFYKFSNKFVNAGYNDCVGYCQDTTAVKFFKMWDQQKLIDVGIQFLIKFYECTQLQFFSKCIEKICCLQRIGFIPDSFNIGILTVEVEGLYFDQQCACVNISMFLKI
eukprot:TRINITY_DN2693_c2_g3_i1.p3 TRINITY_DN2693_c2_g3~~TRINITY_DN2693_c2_g3_i1.p3  ORF type:complete len:131 (-),score=3.57 TRINITY_DN2693_c2_g3_i1:46-438(-)